MNKFNLAIRRKNFDCPPVWFMRQAGRYHSHYQKLKEKHSFMDLCKKPVLACETTMGPIADFDFDAAILFSDLLFPLEAMGMGLSYEPGPKLSWHLNERSDINKLKIFDADHMSFQADAMRMIRHALPQNKGLLGFVGGPATLFSYAVEGSHQGSLLPSKSGMLDGRFSAFSEMLIDGLAKNMALQAKAGADVVAIFDTCAGEFELSDFKKHVLPAVNTLIRKFKVQCPETPVTYYSKGTGVPHLRLLDPALISCIGIDWNVDLVSVLDEFGEKFAVQGNIDPNWLFLEPMELKLRLLEVFAKVKVLPIEKHSGWICGLGHGVLQKTPEGNVRNFVTCLREYFEI